MEGIIAIFFSNDRKLSSLLAQISEHNNSLNHKMHFFDKISKMIVNLGSRKCEYKNNSICQLNNIQNLLLMGTSDTPKKDASNVDRNQDNRKVRTTSIHSSSTLFSCSILAMYNKSHPEKKV